MNRVVNMTLSNFFRFVADVKFKMGISFYKKKIKFMSSAFDKLSLEYYILFLFYTACQFFFLETGYGFSQSIRR